MTKNPTKTSIQSLIKELSEAMRLAKLDIQRAMYIQGTPGISSAQYSAACDTIMESCLIVTTLGQLREMAREVIDNAQPVTADMFSNFMLNQLCNLERCNRNDGSLESRAKSRVYFLLKSTYQKFYI